MWTHGDTKILRLTVGVTVSFGGFGCPGAKYAVLNERRAGLRMGIAAGAGRCFGKWSVSVSIHLITEIEVVSHEPLVSRNHQVHLHVMTH